MKFLVISSIFMASSLFANYAYQGQNSGKIDMHGGKSDKLIKSSKNFKSGAFNSLGELGLKNNMKSPKTSENPHVKKKELKTKPTK